MKNENRWKKKKKFRPCLVLRLEALNARLKLEGCLAINYKRDSSF